MISSKLDRRGLMWLLLDGVASHSWCGSRRSVGAMELQVFKNPQCGCCNA